MFDIEVDITHRSKKAFIVAMEVVYTSEYENDKEIICKGYKIENGSLILCSYSEICIPFAYPFNKQQAIEFAWGWLESVEPNIPTPDTDGSVEKGFIVTTKGTGVGSKDWGTF